MNLIRVGVLRGGPSHEYDVSIKSGGTVLKHLSKDKYHAHDIFIDRDGVWHMSGLPVDPHDALSRLDVVVNALHGAYGEDGKVQHLLDRQGIPYTGSGALASAIGMNKALSKKEYEKRGLRTPRHVLVRREDVLTKGDFEEKLLHIFRSLPVPVVTKPVSSGSSVGVSVVKGFHEFEDAIIEAFKYGDTVLVEEFIPGVEATCGVIDGFRGDELYALPPIEIRAKHGGIFDYDAKYKEGMSDEIVPGNFTHEQKEEIMRLAREAHRALGLRHYSRSDFIVTPRRGIYILETNTLPGMTDASLVPKALSAVGVGLPEFLDHIIGLALEGK